MSDLEDAGLEDVDSEGVGLEGCGFGGCWFGYRFGGYIVSRRQITPHHHQLALTQLAITLVDSHNGITIIYILRY
jgi:hypothetical protein